MTITQTPKSPDRNLKKVKEGETIQTNQANLPDLSTVVGPTLEASPAPGSGISSLELSAKLWGISPEEVRAFNQIPNFGSDVVEGNIAANPLPKNEVS